MGQKIILYTTGCSRCVLVKQMLDAHNVQYDEINDGEIIISKGLEQVPSLEIDGKIIEDYAGVLIWLEDNGYYSM